MPGLSAREMLSKLPLRMANGGPINFSTEAAYDQSAAYKRAFESGGEEGVQAYYANLRNLADKYMAGEGQFAGNQPIGVEAYNAMLESGISNTDLINAGVGQDVLNKIFTTPASGPRVDMPTTVESAYTANPVIAAEAARRTAEGDPGVASLQKQAREYLARVQQGGITPAEQSLLRELALEGGYTIADIQAAGIDPSILFNVPEQETPVPTVPTPAPAGPASYVAPEVYQPIEPQPDIFAAGQPALDEAFRASPPRTEVTEPIFGEDQLVGFNYLPAAKLLSATGSGFSFTPPSVTSRPRTLMSTDQLNRYTRGRAAQDLRQLLGPDQASTYNQLRPILDRTGSYGGGLSRSQLFNLARQQYAQDQAMQPTLGGAQGARRTGSIQDYIALNPDVAADFQTQVDEGRLSSDMTLEQFATNHYNTFGLEEMEAGTRAPFSLTSGFTGATGGVNAPLQTRDLRDTTMGTRFFAEGGLAKKPEAVSTDQEPRDTAQTESASMLQNIMSGVSQIPGTVYDYGKDIVQSESPLTELGEDVSFLGKSIYSGLKEDPLGFTLDMIPVVGEIRSGMDVDKYSDLANQAEAAGNTELANTYKQIVAMAAAGVTPMAGMGARAGKRAAISAAEEAATTSARRMLDDVASAAPPSTAAPELPAMGAPARFGDYAQPKEFYSVTQRMIDTQHGDLSTPEQMAARAEAIGPSFQDSVREVTDQLGLDKSETFGVKTLSSLADKINRGYPLEQVTDSIRTRVMVNNAEEAEQAARMIAEKMPLQDRGWQKIPETGYFDRKLNVMHTGPDGQTLIGEIQITTPEMVRAQESGHRYYEVERKLIERYEDAASIPQSHIRRFDLMRQEQRKLYKAVEDSIDQSIVREIVEKPVKLKPARPLSSRL